MHSPALGSLPDLLDADIAASPQTQAGRCCSLTLPSQELAGPAAACAPPPGVMCWLPWQPDPLPGVSGPPAQGPAQGAATLLGFLLQPCLQKWHVVE